MPVKISYIVYLTLVT